MSTTTDLPDLVRDAQRGDVRAFTRLVERHQGMAAAVATAWLGDAAAAEDAVQDAFVDAYLRLSQLREPKAFPGWLRRVVVKHCDRQRRRQRPRADLPDTAADGAPSPEEALGTRDDRRRTIAAVEALPEHERFVVALHYLGGQSVAAIAEFLELSVPAVKKRLFSARQRLSLSEEAPMIPTSPVADKVALFLSLRAGDRDAVRALLSRRPDLVDAEEHWSDEEALAGGFTLAHHLTPLILAAGYGDAGMVDLLLQLGADPEGRCGCAGGETALWAATRAGFDDVARRLRAAGASDGACNRAGLTPDGLRTWRAGAPALAPSERLATGIKALDLWLPLGRGDVIRVHGAAETGLTVLLAELAVAFGAQGGTTVWSSWEPRPWHRRELEVLTRRYGIDRWVEVVTARDDDERDHVLDEGLARAAELRARGLVVHVVFEQEGYASEVEAAFPRLSAAADLTLVVSPWGAVTRGERRAPAVSGPHHGVLCTSPELARRGIWPAIDPAHTTARRPHPAGSLADEARALLAADAPRAELLLRYLTQPFHVATPDNGMPGVLVPAERTWADVRRLIDGDLDAAEPRSLAYRGALDA